VIGGRKVEVIHMELKGGRSLGTPDSEITGEEPVEHQRKPIANADASAVPIAKKAAAKIAKRKRMSYLAGETTLSGFTKDPTLRSSKHRRARPGHLHIGAALV
jgi:hypothetical protein